MAIEERITGKIFTTTVLPAAERDLKRLYKKDGWKFSWKQAYKPPDKQIFKLLIEDSSEIQGLLCLEVRWRDKFIELHLIENAPHNFGQGKRFNGVARNLVAFGCKMSFDMGYEGYVGFTAKTALIQHYIDTLGARVVFRHNRMIIFPTEAKKLVNSYFKNYLDDKEEPQR